MVCEVVFLDDRVTTPSIHEENDRAGTLEHRLVLGPASRDKHRLDPRHLAQAFGHQLAACVELVLTPAVARPARDQHDLGGLGRQSGFGYGTRCNDGSHGEQFPHEKGPL